MNVPIFETTVYFPSGCEPEAARCIMVKPLYRAKEVIMCDTNAYVRRGDRQDILLEHVDYLRADDDGVFLSSIFGEQTTFRGIVEEVSLKEGKIILRPL